MNDSGLVIGIDHIPELVNLSKENISKSHKQLLDDQKIVLFQGDGRKGYKLYAPYDVIYVGAGVKEVPEELVNQLNLGGRLVIINYNDIKNKVIPVGESEKNNQYIYIIDKDQFGKVTWQATVGVVRNFE